MTSLSESIQAKAKAALAASTQSQQVTGMASTASDIVTAVAVPDLAGDTEYLQGIAGQYEHDAYFLVRIRHVVDPTGKLIKPDNYGVIEATSEFLQEELAHLAKSGAVLKLAAK